MHGSLDLFLLIGRQFVQFRIEPGVFLAGGPGENVPFHGLDQIALYATTDDEQTRDPVLRHRIVGSGRLQEKPGRRRFVFRGPPFRRNSW